MGKLSLGFKEKSCLQDIQVSEVPGADGEAAASYAEDPAQTTGERSNSEKQISNVDAIAIGWKKMPPRSSRQREVKAWLQSVG